MLKLRDRRLGVGADSAGRFQLAVAILGQCALHRRHAACARGLRSLMGNCRDRRRWPCDIRERRDRCDGKGRFLPLQRLAASGWLRVDAAGDLSEPQD
jgi:hypothetical protein